MGQSSSMTICPSKLSLIVRCLSFFVVLVVKLTQEMSSTSTPVSLNVLLRCTVTLVEDLLLPFLSSKPRQVTCPHISQPTSFPSPTDRFSWKLNSSTKVNVQLSLSVFPYPV